MFASSPLYNAIKTVSIIDFEAITQLIGKSCFNKHDMEKVERHLLIETPSHPMLKKFYNLSSLETSHPKKIIINLHSNPPNFTEFFPEYP